MKKLVPFLITLLLGLQLSSCHTGKPVANNMQSADESKEILYKHRWQLELPGSTPVPQQRKMAFLQFAGGESARVSGNTGCNNFSGSVELADHSGIKFSPLAVTKMACPGENTETVFLEMMKQVNYWSVNNDKLSLYHDKTLLANFKAIAVPQTN